MENLVNICAKIFGDPMAFQKLLVQALSELDPGKNGAYLGALESTPGMNGASQALSPMGNGAYNAVSGGQNPRHRCNLNLEEHLKYADALVLAGIIDVNTGKSIKQKMTAVFRAENGSSANGGAQTLVNTGNMGAPSGVSPAPSTIRSYADSEFLKARECLLDYLQNLDVELDLDDLAKIEAVVLELEKQAISRNAQGSEGSNEPNSLFTTAEMANEAAKQRLIGSSLGSSSGIKGSKGLPQRAFTREEIANMSTAEFIKNEPQINYQLQNGLL